jgi:hypothetical protein
MTETTQGGCFCRQIRYEISDDPVLQVLCFCQDCLRTSGTAGYGGYMVSEKAFQVTSGDPQVHSRISKEGRTVRRHFCQECGTNLWGMTEFGLVSVAAGTLDNPEIFQPNKKVFASAAPHWARVPEEMEEM